MSLDKLTPTPAQNLTPITPLKPVESITSGGAAGNKITGMPFAEILGQAIQDVSSTRRASVEDAYGLVMGNSSDLHSIMIRSAMETAAVETAVELTTRAVTVYKEIMQMQV